MLPAKYGCGAPMKVAMINDCAFVGETLLKYLPSNIEKEHIKRSRSLWGKTFGLTYKILRTHADIYHVHYLLQDCYIATRLGKKPLIGHAHGSDLREELKTRKWGWIIRSNLKKCDKILVAQPTILGSAKEFNETAEYLPIPFDPQVFFPKALEEEKNEKTIFIASSNDFHTKGTDKFLKALAKLTKPIKVLSLYSGKDLPKAKQLAKELNLNIEFINRVPHHKMNELYWKTDLILGSFSIGQLDTVAIEAMACGRPVVHSILKKFFPACPLEELVSSNEVAEIIAKLLTNKVEIEKRIENQLKYVNTVHSAPIVADRLSNIYSEMEKL